MARKKSVKVAADVQSADEASRTVSKPVRIAKSAVVAKARKTKVGVGRVRGESGGSGRDEVVRRRIIRAAAEIYRECGYERAGMIDIARRLGMTAPALYWYFHSKEEILVAFLEHTIADLLQFVRSLLHSTEPRHRLWEFMYAYVLWQLQQQELSAAYERIYALGHLRNSLPEKQRQRVKSLEREFFGICRDLVAEVHGKSLRPSEVAPVAFSLIGMVEHLITWFRPSGTMSVKQIATLYADLTVSMAPTRLSAAKAARR
ncbi:MAG: TetR/AcrR family transcriptional regulator [Burkholderiales bacterium]|nr:TetR/AcrR family transcriptional regulator [Burkholderiales bacterium]